ncbi:MAG: GerMN domain-containing protein [Nitrospirota bacterium]|nr:MAG: GerMN domain-containing protein [Nitrospirota bacterium]
MSESKPIPYALLFILIIMLFASGYAFLVKIRPPVRTVSVEEERIPENAAEEDSGDKLYLKVYYPSGQNLSVEEREVERVFSQKKILKAALSEFLKGPSGKGSSVIPENTVLHAVFIGSNGTVYINFSEDFRRNFRGDAIDEYLLLKGLYETTIWNVKADDVKLLVDGKEVDTIGGHFSADRPLKQLVTREILFERN